MITATITGEDFSQQINIPTRWEDVSFYDFEKICDIELQSDVKADIFEIYSVLIGLPIEKVMSISVNSCNLLAKTMGFIADRAPFNETNAKEYVEIDGLKYVHKQSIGNESIACYKDWQDELNNLDPARPYKLIPLTLSYFLRPEGEKYSYSKTVERVEVFRKLNCVDAVKLNNFFLRSRKRLKRNTLAYTIMTMAKKAGLMYLQSLLTVSMLPFIVWLVVISLKWMISWIRRLMRFITSFRSKKTSGHTKNQ